MNISSFQKHQDFHILKFEDHLQELPREKYSRKCVFFQIVISKAHNVDVIIDETRFKALDEIICFIAPQQLVTTHVKSVEAAGVGYQLVFSPKFITGLQTDFSLLKKFPFFNINNPPVYYLTKENQKVFFHYMEKIYEYFQKIDENNIEIIRSYLSILLFEGKNYFEDGRMVIKPQSRAQEITFQFENQIKLSLNKRNSLDYYAQKLNISTIYLGECVKKETGKTAKQILTEYLILEAKSLLTQSSSTIDEIAEQVGYSETSNFIAFFKKNTGLTPSLFRKNMPQGF